VAVPKRIFLFPFPVAILPVVTVTGSVPAPVAVKELYKTMAVVLGSTVPEIGGFDTHRHALLTSNVPFEPALAIAVNGRPEIFKLEVVTVKPSDIIPNHIVT
jgi:hypothetical protein